MPLCLSSPHSFAHLVEALLLQRIAGDASAQISGKLFSIGEIFVNFFRVVQTVGNAGVNISQAQSGKSHGNLLRRRALAIVKDYGIEADAVPLILIVPSAVSVSGSSWVVSTIAMRRIIARFVSRAKDGLRGYM